MVCEVADLVDARRLDSAVPEAGVLVVGNTVDVTWTGVATSAEILKAQHRGSVLGIGTDTPRVPADEVVGASRAVHQSLCVRRQRRETGYTRSS